ncbi:MAG: hypothetical protein L0Y66_27505, partial [Myxococcaceae bacterium]|nr:hypothetical protein [Myxococcaceae bacterium]
MRLRFSLPFLLTFLALAMLMGELHEQAHITTGRLLCGGYGARDFNVWQLHGDCFTTHPLYFLPTMMGPLFSFSVAWVGMFLLRSTDIGRRALGLCLILGSGVIMRLGFTSLASSGDEPSIL